MGWSTVQAAAQIHGQNVPSAQAFAPWPGPGQGLRFAGRVERDRQASRSHHDLLAQTGQHGCIDGVWIGVK